MIFPSRNQTNQTFQSHIIHNYSAATGQRLSSCNFVYKCKHNRFMLFFPFFYAILDQQN